MAEPSSPRAPLQSTESMELEFPSTHPGTTNEPLFSAFATAPMAVDTANDPPPPPPKNPPPLSMERSSSLFLLRNIPRSGVEVLAWGGNDLGQLGLGPDAVSSEPRPDPQPVEALRGKDVLCVAAGSFHAAAVTSDMEVYAWGACDEGQCGRRCTGAAADENAFFPAPSRVEALENFRVGLAAAGSNHTVVLTEEGGALAFGATDLGQLGLGEGLSGSKTTHPKVIKALKDVRIARVAAGGNHTLFLEAGGAVHVTGDGSFGQLGVSAESAHSPLPLPRLWPLGVCMVAAGEAHSAVLTLSGAVWTWGRGRSGALGLGTFQNVSEPVQVRGGLDGGAIKQIACGGDHTIAISAAGEAWAFGQGAWGATGLGHSDNVCSPQRMAGPLAEQRVVQAAAGGRHSLLLTEAGEVWATGANGSGQCGCAAEAAEAAAEEQSSGDGGAAVLTPRRVAGLPAGGAVLFVAAGGDFSFAVTQQQASQPQQTQQHGEQWLPSAPQQLLPTVRAALAATERAAAGDDPAGDDPAAAAVAAEAIKDLKLCIERTFGNPAYLTHAFLLDPINGGRDSGASTFPPPEERSSSFDKPATDASGSDGGDDEAFPAAAATGGAAALPRLDLDAIKEAYAGILKLYDSGAVAALGTAAVCLLDAIERHISSTYPPTPASKTGYNLDVPLLPELAWVPPALFISLQNPLASDPATYGAAIVLRLGRLLAMTLPATQRIPVRRALQSLLAQLPPDTFAARCVRPAQRYLTHLVRSGRLGAARLEAMMTGVLLDVLRQANEDAGVKIPVSEFYNDALSKSLDLGAEYMAWVKHREGSPSALVSFCQMPFLLTPEAKSNILHGEAALVQHQSMGAAAMQAYFRGENPQEAGFLRISVRRTHVVEDALNAVVTHVEDLKKPLKVTCLSGGVAEPAQDEGGVRKEFFQLLTRDLFKPEYGMWSYDDATRTHWFNPASLEAEAEFTLVGALLGLAIYNAVLLDVHFPLVMYKKLLGGHPDFADLKAAFPDLGRGLQALLDYEPAEEVESVFCRTFEVEYEFYGEMKRQELIPGGAAIAVTGANRRRYVDAYTHWVLEESVRPQFSAFARGFLKVCGGPALTAFTPSELELLVCGLPHLDFEGLQRASRYEGGYTAESQIVKWFWEVVRGFSLERKRQFLSFTTGSDRAPVGGLAALSMVIQRAGPDCDRLPTSHTCFDTLLLPEYSSKEKLAERLTTAVGNAQGFGLQ